MFAFLNVISHSATEAHLGHFHPVPSEHRGSEQPQGSLHTAEPVSFSLREVSLCSPKLMILLPQFLDSICTDMPSSCSCSLLARLVMEEKGRYVMIITEGYLKMPSGPCCTSNEVGQVTSLVCL